MKAAPKRSSSSMMAASFMIWTDKERYYAPWLSILAGQYPQILFASYESIRSWVVEDSMKFSSSLVGSRCRGGSSRRTPKHVTMTGRQARRARGSRGKSEKSLSMSKIDGSWRSARMWR
jgi:hypothetical protein